MTKRWIAVVAVVLLSASTLQGADDVALRNLREEFARGVRAFEAGREEEAAAAFKKVMDTGLSADSALELRDLVEVRTIVNIMMSRTPQAKETMTRLLELASEAERERLTDPARIEPLIEQLGGSFEVRGEAYVRLTGAGRYAVPGLVKRLLNKDAENYDSMRVPVTVALIRIGDEAVLPLCTALRADAEWLRQDICYILGEISDPRAVPYLLRAAKNDRSPGVRKVAAHALSRVRRFVEVRDEAPEVALFKLARLYYYAAPSVQRASRFGHSVWTWSATVGLVREDVPGFLYNVSMARKVASEALLAAPGYAPTLPLLISTYHKEVLQIERHLEQNAAPGAEPLPEIVVAQIQNRKAKAQGVLLTLRSSGEAHFYRALAMQLRDDQPQLAVAVINDLAALASPNLNNYPDLPELSAPLDSAVLRRPDVERDEPVAVVPREQAPKPEATAPTAAAPDVKTATRPRGVIDPMDIFGLGVAKEREVAQKAEAARPAEPRTVKDATPEELDSLTSLIARARTNVGARRQQQAESQPEVKTSTPVRAVSNPLTQAMRRADKGIRYAAAAALVKLSPTREFEGSRAVVETLGQAITERGYSAVLIVSDDSELANQLREVMRVAGHVPDSAGSANAVNKVRTSFPPKDVILLQDTMLNVFEELKKEPALAGVPVVVFTKDQETAAAGQAYGEGVPVVSVAGGKVDALRSAVSTAILGAGRTAAEGRALSRNYAVVGAEALDAIPAHGSPFSKHLPNIKNALVAGLDREDPRVRLTCIRALGRAKVKALLPRLVLIYGAGDRPGEESQAERRACIEAIGDMMDAGDTPPPEVVVLMSEIHRSGTPELRAFATSKLSGVQLPPATIEQLINDAEAKPANPPQMDPGF